MREKEKNLKQRNTMITIRADHRTKIENDAYTKSTDKMMDHPVRVVAEYLRRISQWRTSEKKHKSRRWGRMRSNTSQPTYTPYLKDDDLHYCDVEGGKKLIERT